MRASASACPRPGGCAIGNCTSPATCATSPDCSDNGIPDECGTDDDCPHAGLYWVQPPMPVSTAAITMEALATDPFSVEYYFSATGAGSHSRDWSPVCSYTDSGLSFEVTTLDGAPAGGAQANTWIKTQTITATGLTPGVGYLLRVKARNYYGQNEIPWFPASRHLRRSLLQREGPLPLPEGGHLSSRELPVR